MKLVFNNDLHIRKAAVLLLFALLTASASFSQPCGWDTTHSVPDAHFESIHFTNASTGYVAGAQLILGAWYPYVKKTTNSGTNWYVQSTPLQNTGNFYFRYVLFADANTGLLTYGNAGGTISGGILRTTNGGNNWVEVSPPVNKHMTSLHFINSLTGYASGYQTVLKTTNAGLNWAVAFQTYSSIYLFAIHFTGVDTGYVVGNSGTILKTTNAGATWEGLYTTSMHLWGVCFINANTGIVVGGTATENIILRTTNAGTNWNSIPYTNGTERLWSVKFISQTTGFITGWASQILKTTNGGVNWVNQCFSPPFQVNFTILSCFFTNANTGYIAGQHDGATGNIFKTTTCGDPLTGINPINIIPASFFLNQNYPNPFNPKTIINYQLPSSNFVKLAVYDVTGKEVAVLVKERLRPGKYEVEFDGSNMPSGIYFYKLITSDFSETKRMILLK